MLETSSGYVRHGMRQRDDPEGCQAMLERWAADNGARPMCELPYGGCLKLLSRPAHKCGPSCWPRNMVSEAALANLDHPEWWKGPAGEWILTAHDYDANEPALQQLAKEYGATLEIDPAGSWYYPRVTTLVVLRGTPPDTPRAVRVRA